MNQSVQDPLKKESAMNTSKSVNSGKISVSSLHLSVLTLNRILFLINASKSSLNEQRLLSKMTNA